MTGAGRVDGDPQAAARGGERAELAAEAEPGDRTVPGSQPEQRAVLPVRYPDVAAGLSGGRGLAAEGYGRRDGSTPRIHLGYGRVERIEHPEPGRARRHGGGRVTDANRVRHRAGPGVDPREGAGAVGRRPDRAVRRGQADRVPARPDYALGAAGARVDAQHRPIPPAGDPQRARAEQDIARLAGQGDRLRHRIGLRVDSGQGAVVPVKHPDLAARGDDAAGIRADGDGGRDRASRWIYAGHQAGVRFGDPHRARSCRHVGWRCSQRHGRPHCPVAGGD